MKRYWFVYIDNVQRHHRVQYLSQTIPSYEHKTSRNEGGV